MGTWLACLRNSKWSVGLEPRDPGEEKYGENLVRK